MQRSSVLSAGLGLLALASVGLADEPLPGWHDNLEAAMLRAQEEGKLVLQFRLIGRFNRPDC